MNCITILVKNVLSKKIDLETFYRKVSLGVVIVFGAEWLQQALTLKRSTALNPGLLR